MPDGDVMGLTLFCLVGCAIAIRLAVPAALPEIEPDRWPCGCRHDGHETWQGAHFHWSMDRV